MSQKEPPKIGRIDRLHALPSAIEREPVDAGQQAAVEPIWPEPLPPRPAVGQAAAAPPPAQVNPVPFAPAPDANAAAAARGQ